MPLPRPDLLNPIPGPNPSGENLRYAPVYDKIKQARTEDEDTTPQGEWQRERKKADWPVVLKLAGDALATKSKDLMLASWLGEALTKREGISGLADALELQRGLLEQFWESLYPEKDEDGDLGLRVMPVEFLATRSRDLLRTIPLTKSGFDWFKYIEAKTVGLEADATTDQKLEARTQAISDGKITGEEFEAALKATPREFYEKLGSEIERATTSLAELEGVCDAKFGNDGPAFGRMRESLEEFKATVRVLLVKKREQEPSASETEQQEEVAEEAQDEAEAYAVDSGGAAAAPARAKKPKAGALAAEPQDWDDAVARIAAVSAYMRKEQPSSPAGYLLSRGFRWGELRAGGSSPDAALLVAPNSETRQQLKRLANEGEWQQVLDIAEAAACEPCGRAWIDLQRYAWRACYELGYSEVCNAIVSGMKSLLTDISSLLDSTLDDDTPTANAETRQWIADYVLPPQATPSSEQQEHSPEPVYEESTVEESSTSEPDVFQAASERADAGHLEEAIEMLMHEAERERAGRRRFQRRAQLAQICLAHGQERVAYPILQGLAQAMDAHRLDEWEDAEMLAQPLMLLFRCVDKLDKKSEEKQAIYTRLCRLSPRLALACK